MSDDQSAENDAPPPVEVTTRFATTVRDLADAWSFVMGRLELVGPDPSVKISPLWSYSVHDMDRDVPRPPRQFEVVVEGMVEEEAPVLDRPTYPPGLPGGEAR